MKKIVFFCLTILSFSAFSDSSMRRCTLLPVTDGVGGAMGNKVYSSIEAELKRSNWCTYVSNADMVHVFSRYKENLPQYIKQKEVLRVVGERLRVGSIIVVSIKNELNGVDLSLDVFSENGEDIYFSEASSLNRDDIELISDTALNWLDVYSRSIPYDAKVIGVLGDQITLDVGKGYPIQSGQEFGVKRLTNKKKHPLFKKIVDWETRQIAEGSIESISDNQALGVVHRYNSRSRVEVGDWVSLKEKRTETKLPEEVEDQGPGSLGIFSVALFGTSSSLSTTAPTESPRMSGNLLGVSLNLEAWITRELFAGLGLERSIGTLTKASGNPSKKSISGNNGSYKVLAGYKYLPIGFFYGPQINFYTGYVRHSYDFDYSLNDGFGKVAFSGLALGLSGNIPLNREYKIFARAEFLPFPAFTDDDGIYESSKSISSMDLEFGVKYNYRTRITLDASFETQSRKAKFKENYKEISYRDNRLKFGASFNF